MLNHPTHGSTQGGLEVRWNGRGLSQSGRHQDGTASLSHAEWLGLGLSTRHSQPQRQTSLKIGCVQAKLRMWGHSPGHKTTAQGETSTALFFQQLLTGSGFQDRPQPEITGLAGVGKTLAGLCAGTADAPHREQRFDSTNACRGCFV